MTCKLPLWEHSLSSCCPAPSR